MFWKKKPPAQLDAGPDQIVPRIKNGAAMLTAVREVVKRLEDLPVVEPLVGDLSIAYAFDLPDVFRMVTARDLERLGLRREELRALALANLTRTQFQCVVQETEPLLQLVVGGNLEACALLVGPIWDVVAERLGSTPVVAVPSRDVVMACALHDAFAVELLAGVALDVHASQTTHALTPELLVRDGERWVLLEDYEL